MASVLTPAEKNQLAGVVNITEVRVRVIMDHARKRLEATAQQGGDAE